MADETQPQPGNQPAASPPARRSRDERLRRPLIGPFTVGQVIGVLGSIVLTAVVLVLLTRPLGAAQPPPAQPRPGASFVAVGPQVEGLRIGDLAPDFTGTTPGGESVQLLDLNGNPIRIADLRGKVVWINFWATWCPPCQEETPILRAMHEKYADDGLALVAVSVQETTADDVRAYVERYGLDYTVGFDATSAIFHTYHAFGLPTQFFLDRDGVIRQVVLGPVTNAEVDGILSGLLAS